MSDIYSAPSAPLTETVATPTGYGSLERGIAGDYQFSIGDTLSEAWAKTKGAKTTILVGCLIYVAVLGGVTIALGFLSLFGNFIGSIGTIGMQVVSQIVTTAVSMPMAAGLVIIGLQRSVGAPISAGTVLRYFPKLLPLLLMTILMYVLLIIGFVLLVIPGIYLTVSYYLALPLMVDKNLGPWQSLEASRKAVTKRWFAIFGFFIVLTLINLVAMIPLLIGLIWSVPMSVIATGILYRNIFGIEPATLNG